MEKVLTEGLSEYLVPFNLNEMDKKYFDVLIIGSGIAGLYTALNLDRKLKIAILSKASELKDCNTYKAQGGIAAAVGKEDDPKYHYSDTVKSGAGIGDTDAIKVLTYEAPKNIMNLINIAEVNFDKKEDGSLDFGREGAHDRNRIVHYKDYTGKYVEEKLIAAINKRENISIVTSVHVVDILRNKCDNNQSSADSQQTEACGVLCFSETNPTEQGQSKTAKLSAYIGKKIILAAGGIGRIYKNTTNSTVASGEGIAMALRAGAGLKDMEFVQFHPTGFQKKDGSFFLISEALRGEGAILRNSKGYAFMKDYHELKELATRDVVARAIFDQMHKNNTPFVNMDITFENKEFLKDRFENIYGELISEGIDISKDMIPVSPVQHYFMGGIRTDTFGRTSVKNLYAVGECACTGIHGANRLASNSLLEGLVFGARAAEDINTSGLSQTEYFQGNIISQKPSDDCTGIVNNVNELTDLKQQLREKCENYLGLIRNEKDITKAREDIYLKLKEIYLNGFNCGAEQDSVMYNELIDVINMYEVALIIADAALRRKESRGSHFRKDYPATDSQYKNHFVYTLRKGELEVDKLDIS